MVRAENPFLAIIRAWKILSILFNISTNFTKRSLNLQRPDDDIPFIGHKIMFGIERRRYLHLQEKRFLDNNMSFCLSECFQHGTLDALSSSIKNFWSDLFPVSGTEEDDNEGQLGKRIGHDGLVLESRKKLI